MNYPHPILAREGWPFIAAALALAVIVWAVAGFAWSLPVWLIAIFVIQSGRAEAIHVADVATAAAVDLPGAFRPV